MEVGVRDLKAKLSEYLDRVADGETITVTHRGRGVALLVPMPGRGNLERGIREGWIRPGHDGPPNDIEPAKPRSGTRTTTEIIRRDRDDE
jgi:prevent-host-death family protein